MDVTKYEKLTSRVLKALEEVSTENSRHMGFSGMAEQLGCRHATGYTRHAFIFDKFGVVYKFPRSDEEHKIDYCEIEVRNYLRAKEYRVEKLLLPIAYVGKTKGGLPVYIQPVCTKSIDKMHFSEREKFDKRVQEKSNVVLIRKIRRACYDGGVNITWVARATQLYGKKFMRSFERWSVECKVNDLHEANVGYIAGSKPIILDYAGFQGYDY